MMKLWVDADACPAPVKEILFRAAARTGLSLTLVANHPMRRPKASNIGFLLVAPGEDVADGEIVKRMEPVDLIVTADIPLAAAVIEKGGLALDPRGHIYSTDDIRNRLSLRNFMSDLRSAGVETGGPAAFGMTERRQFAAALDKILTSAAQSKAAILPPVE